MSNNRSKDDSRRMRQNRRSKRRRDTERSVGATAISASGARNIGLPQRSTRRAYGRGETARRVEATSRMRRSRDGSMARTSTREPQVFSFDEHMRASDARRRAQAQFQGWSEDQSQSQDPVVARPAVYTSDTPRESLTTRLRARVTDFHLPSFGITTIPLPLVVALAIALLVAVVAGPARNYYAAWRDSGMLEAEYAALAAQNEELNDEIERLQTLEGIEDEARRRGYVSADEEALVVKDLEDKQVADPALVDEAVAAYERSLPWYIHLLDTLFGYQHE